MCDTNDTTGGCCNSTLSIGRPGERHDGPGSPRPASAPGRPADATPDDAVVTTFGVAGMTCSHCVASVTEELSGLAGVADVRVELVAGGVSTVTVRSASALDEETLAGAVDEAGYELAASAS
ncbi:heavy-metal-associated domain-containing protein [Agromyces salentinus]|uniref:HMA domain-containing protein n=1 Tax=Agromyces salentinus TaxID=269421 RepID=A0ABN2MI43_9MICO|nr:heavy-metal-associated domain-containing protein [Agromyces salentinus]